MAIITNDNYQLRAPKPIDNRTGYATGATWNFFATVAEFLANSPYRFPSMTVPFTVEGEQVEYWFVGGVEDADFVLKLGSALTPDLQEVTGQGNITTYTIVAAPAVLDTELSTLGQVKFLIGSIDVTPYELKVNKQDSLTADGTGIKYPTVDAVNLALANANIILNSKANIAGQVFTGNISAPNLSGANTGDQDLSPYQLISNLQSNLTASAVKYPSVDAVIGGLDLKANLLGGNTFQGNQIFTSGNVIFSGNTEFSAQSSYKNGSTIAMWNSTDSQFVQLVAFDLTSSYSAILPDKIGTQTFAMLSDIIAPDLTPYELLSNKVSDLSAPNANTYINTLGLSNLLDDKVNVSTTITGGYGITVGGDLSSDVSVTLNTAITDNRYLRKDVNDTNGTFGLTLGSLITETATVQSDLTLPSLGVGTGDDILIVNGAGLVQKKTLVIAGDFGVADAAGTNQFDVALGTNLRFAGANDTTVSFDAVTNTVTFSSIPGTGGGGAVLSFNTRTGAVVPVSGDYNSGMVPEMTNLYFTDARVRAVTLTGFTPTNSAILATDNAVQAFGKAQGQINTKVGSTRELTIAGTAGRIMIGGGETQDLSANRQWTVDMATIGTTGTYKSVTTDAYGRVTAGTNPTTLGGFGITDAYTKTEADGKYYLQTNPAGYITASSLPDLSPYALKASTITAGTGLTGGGDLSANRTLSANFGTASGTIAQGNDSRINNGQTAFGWGNHASAGYALTNGTNATGTWPISVTGTALSWSESGNQYEGTAFTGTPTYLMSYDPTASRWKPTTLAGLNAFVAGASMDINISGNSATTTRFGGQLGNFSSEATSIVNFLVQQPGGDLAVATIPNAKTALNIGDGSTLNNSILGRSAGLNGYSAGNQIAFDADNTTGKLKVSINGGSSDILPADISGNAATVTGFNPDENATAGTIVRRSTDGNNFIRGGFLNMSSPAVDGVPMSDFVTTNGDGTLRRNSATAVRTFLGSPSGGETLQSVMTRNATTTIPMRMLSGSDVIPSLSFGDYTGYGWGILERATEGNLDISRFVAGVKSNVITLERSTGNVGIGTSPITKLDIGGNIKWGDGVYLGSSVGSLYNNITNGTVLTSASGTDNDFILANKGGSTVFEVPTGTQNLNVLGNVTAPQFNGALNGNANSATTWGGSTANFSGVGSSLIYFAGFDVNVNVQKPYTIAQTQSALGLGSNAYTSTAYLPLTGGTLTGGVTSTSSFSADGGFFDTSDIRLKNVVQDTFDTSELQAISFRWKDESVDSKVHVGYSAQDVQKVMPDAVNVAEDGKLSVNYTQVLVQEIQILKNRIQELERRIN